VGRSIRRRLIFGWRGERRRDRERADLGGQLAGVEAGARRGPILRRQLKIAIARPMREDAEEIGQVHLGVEAVQPRRRDQGKDVAGTLAVRVAADEEPPFSADDKTGVILPMSNFARSSTIGGIPPAVKLSTSIIESLDGARRSSFAG